jgi:hypothetical protein
MLRQHSRLKKNFPPSREGKYTKNQADDFARGQIFQWLAYDHRDFLEKVSSNIENFQPGIFLSIRLYSYVIFYKYYLGQRDPIRPSDFGDLFHLFSIPYCEIAVMERDLCNVLNQIKQNHDVLDSTEVFNIDFVKTSFS